MFAFEVKRCLSTRRILMISLMGQSAFCKTLRMRSIIYRVNQYSLSIKIRQRKNVSLKNQDAFKLIMSTLKAS